MDVITQRLLIVILGITLIYSMFIRLDQVTIMLIGILATLFETKKLSEKESEVIDQAILNKYAEAQNDKC